MNINYHVDYTHEFEETVSNVKDILDCLKGSTKIWINNKECI
jgi:hypothetical protein